MDYSYILNTSVPQKEKLLAFGTATNEKYVDFLQSYFKAPGDTPWVEQGDGSITVYRCPNNKWFALVMQINCFSPIERLFPFSLII